MKAAFEQAIPRLQAAIRSQSQRKFDTQQKIRIYRRHCHLSWDQSLEKSTDVESKGKYEVVFTSLSADKLKSFPRIVELARSRQHSSPETEKTALISFTTRWTKGKDHCTPDVLSRSPVAKEELENNVHAIVINSSRTTLEDDKDDTMNHLRDPTLDYEQWISLTTTTKH